MTEYLLFRLYGPMASWGDIAVGEYRPSFTAPTRSAILGLVAAALGIRRDQEDSLTELTESYGFAAMVEARGSLLRDFHTWQISKPKKGATFESRRQELAGDVLDTGLSRRDYYCDALYQVCLWVPTERSVRHSLSDIKAALERPRFPLYLGRKSCPPALPLKPAMLTAENVKDAFRKVSFPESGLSDALPPEETTAIHWDDGADAGTHPQHTILSRDVPLNRGEWQFTERTQHYRIEKKGKGE